MTYFLLRTFVYLCLLAGLTFACQSNTLKTEKDRDTLKESARITLNARKMIDEANGLMGKQDYAKAIELYTKIVTIAKDDSLNSATAYHNRGLAYQYLKDTTKALADYEKAMSLDKTYNSPYSSRGSIRLERKNLQGALEDFNKSAELEPQNALTYFLRGNVKLAQKDKEGACQDWKKALALGFADAQNSINQECK